jgi:hypothetical protein
MDQKVVDLLVQIVRLLSHGFDARQASPKDVGNLESSIEELLKHDADPEVTRLLAAQGRRHQSRLAHATSALLMNRFT